MGSNLAMTHRSFLRVLFHLDGKRSGITGSDMLPIEVVDSVGGTDCRPDI